MRDPETRACIQYTVTDDALIEPTEQFDIFLSTTTEFAIVDENQEVAIVNILDNDDGKLSVCMKQY